MGERRNGRWKMTKTNDVLLPSWQWVDGVFILDQKMFEKERYDFLPAGLPTLQQEQCRSLSMRTSGCHEPFRDRKSPVLRGSMVRLMDRSREPHFHGVVHRLECIRRRFLGQRR